MSEHKSDTRSSGAKRRVNRAAFITEKGGIREGRNTYRSAKSGRFAASQSKQVKTSGGNRKGLRNK